MPTPYLILDIETIPDTERWSPPADAIAEGRDVFAPLWAHRVVAIGCMLLNPDYTLRRIGTFPAGAIDAVDVGDEANARELALLDAFARFIDRDRPLIITYNGRGFDLPVIVQRAMFHGLELGWYYDVSDVRYRYSESGHLDLCDHLHDFGAARRMGSLDDLAKLIGLPGKVGVDGSQVAELHRAGKLDEIERYCLSDVAQTAMLFLRFRRLQGRLDGPGYRTAVYGLLASLGADERFAELIAGINTDRLLAQRPQRDEVRPTEAA
jgi:predicted PolB exonuclease-like 3'-5' exonuclease